MAGSPFAAGGNPLALVVDPSGNHLYSADAQPSAVSGFTIDTATGALLHVANGTNVDCFTVDASSGVLTSIGTSYTSGRAEALAVDAPDNYLYVLDNVDNQLEVFSINSTNYYLALISGNPYPLFAGASGQNLGASSITVMH